MTVIHIVLFKFLPSVSASHKVNFTNRLQKLQDLPCVLNKQLFVGSPSITSPLEKSRGYEIALVSFHHDRKALEEYQASDGHRKVTEEYLWPFKEDVVRFDFEVDEDADGEAVVRTFIGGKAEAG